MTHRLAIVKHVNDFVGDVTQFIATASFQVIEPIISCIVEIRYFKKREPFIASRGTEVRLKVFGMLGVVGQEFLVF